MHIKWDAYKNTETVVITIKTILMTFPQYKQSKNIFRTLLGIKRL